MGISPAPGRSHLPPQPMHLVPGMKSHHAQEGPTAFLPSHPAPVPTLFRWRGLGLAGLQLAFYREHRGRRPQLTSSPGKVGASSCRLGTGGRTSRGSQRRSDEGGRLSLPGFFVQLCLLRGRKCFCLWFYFPPDVMFLSPNVRKFKATQSRGQRAEGSVPRSPQAWSVPQNSLQGHNSSDPKRVPTGPRGAGPLGWGRGQPSSPSCASL